MSWRRLQMIDISYRQRTRFGALIWLTIRFTVVDSFDWHSTFTICVCKFHSSTLSQIHFVEQYKPPKKITTQRTHFGNRISRISWRSELQVQISLIFFDFSFQAEYFQIGTTAKSWFKVFVAMRDPKKLPPRELGSESRNPEIYEDRVNIRRYLWFFRFCLLGWIFPCAKSWFKIFVAMRDPQKNYHPENSDRSHEILNFIKIVRIASDIFDSFGFTRLGRGDLVNLACPGISPLIHL